MGDRKKYILALVSIIVMIVFIVFMSSTMLASNKVQASSESIYYYGSEYCGSCSKIQWVLDELEDMGVTVVRKDINDADANEEFSDLVQELGMDLVVPTLVKGDDFLQGVTEIEEGYIDLSKSEVNDEDSKTDLSNSPDDGGSAFSLGVVVLAGLIDGVNPCAISMLLFFMTLLINSDKKNILLVSLSYSLGIFVIYLSIGLGASAIITRLGALKYARLVIYVVSLLILLRVWWLEYKDYKSFKKGDIAGITNELDKSRKDKIHEIFRSSVGSKFMYLTTFVVGLVVGVLEFSCTGQVYIPTVNYMISAKGTGSALGYLIIYNIMFILPLLVVTFLVYKAKDSVGTMGVSVALVEQRGKIILATILLYSGLILYFMYKVYGEILVLM